MRRLCWGSLVAITGLILTGCAQQKPAMDPVAAAAQLSTGAPLLRCREDCVADWRRAQPTAAQLDAAGRWAELAALVIGINYQDDLTLYYLARAAEGLGYPAAAASYYRQSTYISGSSLSCQHASGVCGGVVMPDTALARVDALESQARPSRFQPRRHPATAAKPSSTGSKPLPPADKPEAPGAPESGPRQPAVAEPEPQQPAAILQPREAAVAVPEPNRPTASDGSGPIRQPPPARPLQPPEPTRVDPVANQYIEPPAGR